MFRIKPLAISMGSYSVMYALSDMSQQKLVTKKHKVEPGKTLRVSLVAGVVVAPLVFSWMRFVEFMFPGRTALAVAKKVISEQILFSPVVVNSFYIATSYLEGKDDLLAESKTKFIETYKTGLTFWPIIQTINFAFVPTDKKIYLLVAASFLWSNYLCYMKERDS